MKNSGKELKEISFTCWLSAWDRMALAASNGLSTSMLTGLRKASAAEELHGEIMKHGLSMTVICLSNGTICMLLEKELELTGIPAYPNGKTTWSSGLDWTNSAQQSDPIYHHCFMFMWNPNIQSPSKISTMSRSGPNTTSFKAAFLNLSNHFPTPAPTICLLLMSF